MRINCWLLFVTALPWQVHYLLLLHQHLVIT